MSLLFFVMLCFVTEAEDEVIKARLELTSGHVTVRSIDYGAESDENVSEPKRASEYDLWFEGDRIRTSISTGTIAGDGPLVPFDKTDSISIRRRIISKNVPIEISNPPRSIVHMHVADATNQAGQKKLGRSVFDARLIGLQPVSFGLLHSCSLREFVGSQVRDESHISDGEWNGIPCWLVQFSGNAGSAKIWIAKDKGPNPVCCELIMNDNERYQLENELEQFGDVWFPSKVTYREFSRDGELKSSNISTILHADFNLPIPKDKFDPVDLKIADGTMLIPAGKSANPVGIWDKNHFREVVRADVASVEVQSGKSAVPKGNLFFLLITGVGGLMLVILLVRRGRETR